MPYSLCDFPGRLLFPFLHNLFQNAFAALDAYPHIAKNHPYLRALLLHTITNLYLELPNYLQELLG